MTKGIFSAHLIVEDGPDGRRDKLMLPLSYVTKDGLWVITVPEGFVTDYASIPRALTFVIPVEGPYNKAAVVHDFLYQTAPVDPRTNQRCTWSTADAVFKEACEALGVGRFRTLSMWLALRSAGWLAWSRYRKAEQS